jgi:calcium-dependent protein kinase
MLKPPKPGMELCNLEMTMLESRFALGKKLGQGGQGAVYLATENATGTKRVVKFYGKQACSVEDIKDEFELLKRLDHPNVARICEAFQDYQNIYVISEPYTGGDLCTLVEKAQQHGVPLTHQWLGCVFLQILEGIRYLHKHKTMHCDLKEMNVMIATDDAWHNPPVMLIDFGMAKNYSGVREGGTPGYMPPEFWSHQMWTPKGDIFALAITFWGIYNMRPGQGGPFARPPTPGLQGLQMFQATSQATQTQPLDCSAFPPGLREVVQEMGTKDFMQRPSAKEVLEKPYFKSLDAADEGEPLDASMVQGLIRASQQNTAQNMCALVLAENKNLGELNKLNDFFRNLDTDDNGTISADDVRATLPKVGLGDQVQSVIDCFGADGKILYTEFMAKMIAAQEGFTKANLAVAFKSMDKDGNGTLSRGEIAEVMKHKNMETLTEGKSVDDMLAEMDQNGDGEITFSEFAAVMTGQPAKPKPMFSQGDAVEYLSVTAGKWMPCKITSVDTYGRVQLDVKPGAWLDVEFQKAKLRKGGSGLPAGYA